ncbi:MAG TPA: hypothetical protein VFK05_21240 [Polyangiaceae bacterium]|nr:hypothetical protein [Polyangiaceae bacterium]
MMLAACGSSTSSEPQNQGGSGAVADHGAGGSKAGSGTGGAGSDSGGVSGGAMGGSDSAGSLNRAGSGGSSGNAGSGASSGNAGGAGASGANAGSGGGAPLACGSTTCGASQYCVIPCCGGTAPSCFPASSDGKCPAGSHSGCTTNPTACTSPSSCCQQDDCSPPPPYCSDAKPTMCFPSPGVPGEPQGRICQKMCA